MPVERADLGEYDQRLVSADGVVIGLRSQTTHSPGTLEFWSKAVANELTNNKGYQLAGAEDATGTNGRKCKFMTFHYSLRGNSMTYLLAIFVDGQGVLLAEAGGQGRPGPEATAGNPPKPAQREMTKKKGNRQ